MTTTDSAVSLNRPLRRTKTRRDTHAHAARKALSAYRSALTIDADETRPGRLSRLLWAAAFIEQAIYLESGGSMGDPSATPSRVVQRLRRVIP